MVVAIVVFAPQLGGALAGALGASGAAAMAITAAVGIALTAGATMAMRALGLMPRPAIPGSRGGTPSIFRQSITESFIVYGRRRVSGLLVFFHSKKELLGPHLRYFVIACAGHRCQGNPVWMLNDQVVTVDGSGKVTSGPYANNAWLWFQQGNVPETANATFVAECDGKWTSAHRGDGIAAIYAKFKMTDDVVEAGMPNITAIIDGKNDIVDPRDGVTKYTNNAALVIYDWMKMPREEGGFGAYADEIPSNAWISAQANVADEMVSVPGGSERRYAIDGVIITGAAPSDIRDTLITNCAGSYSYTGGKHLIRVGYYVPPSEVLEEADLAGPIQVNSFLTGDVTANRIDGTFVDAANSYQGQPFTSMQLPGATDIRQMDIDFGFITSRYRAERVASIMLNRAAAERTVTWPMNIMGLKVQALDTVQLNTSRYGLSNYAFTVTNWGVSADFNVVLSLREENPDIYVEPSHVPYVAPPVIATPTPVTTTAEAVGIIGTSFIVSPGAAITASDAGSNATISIGAHTRRYSDKDVAVNAGSVTGLSFSTQYYVYYDDASRAGGAVTYGAATTADAAGPSSSTPGRHYVGTVRTPADGAASTTGTSTTTPWQPSASLNTAQFFDFSAGIRSSGNSTAAAGAGVEVRFAGTTGVIHSYDRSASANRSLNIQGSDIGIYSNGGLSLAISSAGAVNFALIGTTASAANAVLDPVNANNLLRSTSSGDFKRDIRPITDDEAMSFLNVEPVAYKSACEADDPDQTFFGYVSEQALLHRPELVHWGYRTEDYDRRFKRSLRLKKRAKLKPAGFMYDRAAAFLHVVIRKHERDLTEVRMQLGDHEQRLRALEESAGRGKDG